MPTSQHRQISPILDLITHLHPSDVLDVGVGVGTYGFLCAVCGDQDRLLRGHERSPVFRIDGIEGFEPYVGPIQRAIYDKIYVGNLLEVLPTLSTNEYDLVLLIDVLEHIDPERTDEAVAMCRRVGKAVLVSTPHLFASQGHFHGNELEEHRSHPTRAQLGRAGLTLVIPDDTSLIAFGSDDGAFLRYYSTRLRRARLRAAMPTRVREMLASVRSRVEGEAHAR